MFSADNIKKLVGQVLIVAVGALIAMKVNERMGMAKIAPPKKEG